MSVPYDMVEGVGHTIESQARHVGAHMIVTPAKGTGTSETGQQVRRIYTWEEGLSQVRATPPTADTGRQTSAAQPADRHSLPPEYYFG